MRLYSGKINTIAEEVVRALTADGDLEIESTAEVELDVQSVLKEYLRVERDVNEEAKNRMEARGMGYSQLGKMKSQVAKERNTVTGEDSLPYLIDQILEMLFHSKNVIEVFAEDAELRKKIAPIMRKHMDVEGELDKEVRAKIKNLEEGTAAFDVEYAKMMEQQKRNKGLG
ncbi:MAG: DUF507 family protein [Sandaracinaceae bacterium]|nr:DUF507 family protein [Sandaracinaceae bacterium]